MPASAVPGITSESAAAATYSSSGTSRTIVWEPSRTWTRSTTARGLTDPRGIATGTGPVTHAEVTASTPTTPSTLRTLRTPRTPLYRRFSVIHLAPVSRILVIDDDQGVRDSMARMLRGAGYSVETAETGEDGVALARGNVFDVILSDMRMPGMSGIDVLKRLRDQRVDAAFIVMTGFGTVDTAVEAMKLGAVDFVQKPFFRDELLMRVKSVTDRRQLARQVDLLQRQARPAVSTLDALVGESEPMQRVKDLLVRAPSAPGTVLITGETGTGKELVARAIHAVSPRAAGPFVALNCAALTDSLLENELFGHARGAFTGAAGARAGLIEHASGGTLFLDEIGTMPAGVQAKLLRALEAGEVRRIGENEVRRVDVRFVAATNTDLQSAVDAGTFRADLFYRLNVHRIHLPPLRDRPGDVERLIAFFLEQTGGPVGVTAINDAARQALLSYD